MDKGVSIDYLIVANHAEAVNGLLYLSGGGFTEIHRPAIDTLSYINNFSVALSVFIPTDEVNKLHTFTIRLQSQDGTIVLSEAGGSFRVGTPPNAPEDTELHVVVAVQFNIIFPTAGSYHVLVTVDGREETKKETRFYVHDMIKGA